MSEIERSLPQNLDAERSVLGTIVLDNHALSVAVEQVRGEDFFLPQNRLIFDCMVQLAEKQEPIDPITLMEHLERLGQLGAAGGAAYLSQLADGQPRVTNVEYYARIVKEKSVMRRLINSMAVIQEQAFDSKYGAEGLISRATALFSQVDTGTSGWRDMFHSVAEFETAEPLTFSIRNFLQNNGATLIGGLSGHGKTLILLSIAGAQLRGKGTLLWNHFEVLETAERVIYLIPECSIEPFKHRLELFGLFPFVRDGRLLVRTLSKGPTPCLSDPRILAAAKGAHMILDTAVRFADGEENSSGDNQRGLATDIFALLGAGARQVLGAHHSPKPFAKETVMTLENVLRGSGDIGAMLSTAWGIKQIDAEQNIIHIENIKPRDFLPPGPFQLIGRPFINESGDFRMHKTPNECGSLADEHQPDRDKGGAPIHVREARASNTALIRQWLRAEPKLSSRDLSELFKNEGIKLGDSAIRKYRKEMGM